MRKILLVLALFMFINVALGEILNNMGTSNIGDNLAYDLKIIRGNYDLESGVSSLTQKNMDSIVRSFLSKKKPVFGIDPGKLSISSSYINQNSKDISILKYSQTYNGLPIYSSPVIVAVQNGKMVTLKSNYHTGIDIDTKPVLSEKDAIGVVDALRSENISGNKPSGRVKVDDVSLLIFPERISNGIKYHLAYKIEQGLSRSSPAKWVYFVDAKNGEILEKYDRIVYSTLNGKVTGSVFPESPNQVLVTKNFSNMTLFRSQTSTGDVFWSGKGDNLYKYITTKNPIDLSGVSRATLEFNTKYYIETGWDYGYATISTDGYNYSDYEVYTGNLTNWSTRRINISGFAGQQIWIGFFYITDELVQYDGMYIDDIKVETDTGTKFYDPGTSFSNWDNNGYSIATQNVENNSAMGNTVLNGSYSFSGLPGSFLLHSELSGPYVQVINDSGINEYLDMNINTPYTQDINWGTYDTSYKKEQSNVLYHVNKVHDFFTRGSPFNIYSMNYQTMANVQFSGSCNAFSDGNNIYFYGAGGGCEATSLFSDIIYHEYTHSVVDHVYAVPLPYRNESGALNEGWADYFAGAINNNSCMAENFTGSCLRELVNTFRYPDDIAGEVHDDSRIVSGAAWDLRQLVGNTTADNLVINAMKLEPYNFSQYLEDIIVVDDNNSNLADGTPHMIEICTAFYNNHGIFSTYCNGVNLSVDTTERTTGAGTNATYTLFIRNNGSRTDTYNLTLSNTNGASTAVINASGNITLDSGAVHALLMNVTDPSSGTFLVNVTAISTNDPGKIGSINTSTIVMNATGDSDAINNLTIFWNSDGSINLSWPNTSSSYDIFTTTNFTAGFGNGPEVTLTGTSWKDASAASYSERYYRVVPNGSTTFNRTVGKFDLVLKSGMNLVSLPLIPMNNTLSRVLHQNATFYPVTHIFDRQSNGGYKIAYFLNDYPPDYWWSNDATFTDLGMDKGYWFQLSQDYNLTIVGSVPSGNRTVILNNGLNLVGWSSVNTTKLWSAISQNATSYNVTEIFDRQFSGGYRIAYFLNDYPPDYWWDSDATFDSLQPGKGYWLKVTGQYEWSYSS